MLVSTVRTEQLTIGISASLSVTGILTMPAGSASTGASPCYVMAHAAGAVISQPFMAAVATGLCKRGIVTLRYQFPYMDRSFRGPDQQNVAHLAVRSAIAAAARRLPDSRLVAGGKSFGGHVTSQVQAVAPLPNVRGLVFFGYPLHVRNKPSAERAAHLGLVHVPMLFLQGTRDVQADLATLGPMVEQLGIEAKLRLVEGADHAFRVPLRSGRTDAQALSDALDVTAGWIAETAASPAGD